MILKYPSSYKNFKCIAGACPDSCCAGWEVVVDEVAKARFEAVNSPFGERLRAAMTIDAEGDTIFKNTDNHCPFLNAQNLCDIHIQLGPEYLCETCDLYPRYFVNYGPFTEQGLSFSCPEALRMLLADNASGTFVTETLAQALPQTLKMGLSARNLLMTLFSQSSFSAEARLLLALDYGMAFSALFWQTDEGALKALNARYKTVDFLKARLRDLINIKKDVSVKLETTIFRVLLACEHQATDFSELLFHSAEKFPEITRTDYDAYLKAESQNSHYFKTLALYYLHRYFLTDAEAGEALISLQLLALTWTAQRILLFLRWQAQKKILTLKDYVNTFYHYSREIEHSLPNMDALYEALMTEADLSPTAFKSYLAGQCPAI